MEWTTCLNEYEKLVIKMDTPRVVIDNAVCATATLVKVDSASRKHGVLLEAIQVLTDLNLSVKKAYISSDGRWFMDVFHVTDQFGHKLTDDSVISYLEQVRSFSLPRFERKRAAKKNSDLSGLYLQSLATGNPEIGTSHVREGLTAMELMGTDRPGLLSEVFAVLADLRCGVVEATVWTHNGRIACLLFVKDDLSGSTVEDAHRIRRIESRLRQVLKSDHDVRGAKAVVATTSVTHPDRRLHQLMLADRYHGHTSPSSSVSVQNCVERRYSVVSVQCRDRPKLLFDVVCTLTEMEYVVFHGTVDTDGDLAHQEFYVRHNDGTPISSEAEKQRVIQSLKAAIERRTSEGTRLELYMEDRPGLLSDVTRTFRENGLLVTRAEVATKAGMASNVFYVSDAGGETADPKAIEAVRRRIGLERLMVKEEQRPRFQSKESADGDEAQSGVGIGLFYLELLEVNCNGERLRKPWRSGVRRAKNLLPASDPAVRGACLCMEGTEGRVPSPGLAVAVAVAATTAEGSRSFQPPPAALAVGVVGEEKPAGEAGGMAAPVAPLAGLVVGPAGVGVEGKVKKKRGRPRKYGPDGSLLRPLNPMPISASAPTGLEYTSVAAVGAAMKRGRGRPLGSVSKSPPYGFELEDPLGEMVACSAGANFTPHVITVPAGEDVTMKIISFSQQGPRAICILSANGVISNVTLRQPDSSGGTLTYEGRFELLSLSGSFMPTENGGTRSRSGGLSVSLASPDGRVVGGGVAGSLVAASPVQVVVGSFLPSYKMEQKIKKPRLETGSASTPTSAIQRSNTTMEEALASGQGQQSSATMNPNPLTASPFSEENWSASLQPAPGATNTMDINTSLPGG
ncbi:unnamed protein product [Musa acuminata subsp. burmannicoides]